MQAFQKTPNFQEIFDLKSSIVKEMEFLRTLFQKNANISAQGVRILDLKPVLETLVNPTKNLRTRK
jgi:hypothetical protein